MRCRVHLFVKLASTAGHMDCQVDQGAIMFEDEARRACYILWSADYTSGHDGAYAFTDCE